MGNSLKLNQWFDFYHGDYAKTHTDEGEDKSSTADDVIQTTWEFRRNWSEDITDWFDRKVIGRFLWLWYNFVYVRASMQDCAYEAFRYEDEDEPLTRCYKHAWLIRTGFLLGVVLLGFINVGVIVFVYMNALRQHERSGEEYNFGIMLEEVSERLGRFFINPILGMLRGGPLTWLIGRSWDIEL